MNIWLSSCCSILTKFDIGNIWLLCCLILKIVQQGVCKSSFCDMSHKIEFWDWLRLLMLKVKLYYESIHLGHMDPYKINSIWVRNEFSIIPTKWTFC